MRRIAVVYDLGSASAYDIIGALEGYAEPVFVCSHSRHEDIPYEVLGEFGHLCDISDLDRTEAIQRIKNFEPDGIITFSDHVLELTAKLAVGLGLPFHDLSTVEALTRKSVQRRLLNASGASCVVARPIRDASSLAAAWSEIGGAAVLKPDRGTGSRSTYRLLTDDDVRRAAGELFSETGAGAHELFVLEREIPSGPSSGPWGDYVSVDSVVFDSAPEHLAVCGKFPLAAPFRETGSFFPDALPDDLRKEVLEVVERGLRGIGVRSGLFHTEVKLSADGPQIIEVNGRLGGRVNDLMLRAGGPNAVTIAARVALGDWTGPAWQEPLPQCVSFMFAKVPPQGATQLLSIEGLESLQGRAEVSRVLGLQQPGQALDWRTGRLGHTYICFGVVDSHADLEMLISEMDDIARVRYA